MKHAFLNVLLYSLLLLAGFAYLGHAVTRVSGGAVRVVEGVGPEAGESIFWGKGKCHTCHAVGDRGSAIRGPNQGDKGPLGLPIGSRAEERAKERSAKTGKAYTATDYLLESLAHPGAYVVEGFKDEMPVAYRPPVSLKPEEIKAVIAYLQSLGGEGDPGSVERSPFWKEIVAGAAQAVAEKPFEPYLKGDPEMGREIFFGRTGGCSKCHTVAGKGGDVGPELTAVAGTRSAHFLVESVLDPSAKVASGFEKTIVVRKDGREVAGVKKGESERAVEVRDKEGKLHTIPRSEIEVIDVDPVSIMPENFADVLNITEFHHLLAFLLTLKGELPIGETAPRLASGREGGTNR